MTKLKSNTRGEPPSLIPRYISSRNAIAAKDGLTIEVTRHRDVDGTEAIRSTWRGTEAQFQATGLVNRRVRFPRRTTYNADVPPGLIWGCREASVALSTEEGGVYRLVVDDPAPREIRAHRNPGVEVLDYPNRTVYDGSREALLAAKLITPKDLPPKGHRNKGASFDKATQLQPDGSFIVVVEKSKEQIRAENRPEYASVDEFRGALFDIAVRGAAMVFRQAAVSQKGRLAFQVRQDGITAITNAYGELGQAIRSATIQSFVQDVRTEEEKAEFRELVVKAETEKDPRFLAMLKGLGLLPGQAAGGVG